MKVTDSRHRIEELINILNIKPVDFCRHTGINKSALSNYLNGNREPRQNQIAKMADAYNIDPAWLMGYEVPMYRNPAPEEYEKHWNTIGGGKHPLHLSDVEHSLVVNFRASDPVTQSNVLKLLDINAQGDAHTLHA